jgi:tetratricopeptide (TPR) repeat protein
VWRGKGDAIYMMGRYEEAVKAYDKALQIDPESGRAHLGKGDALKVLLRNEVAMNSIDKALEINPNSAEAWGSKGYVFSNCSSPRMPIMHMRRHCSSTRIGWREIPVISTPGLAKETPSAIWVWSRTI